MSNKIFILVSSFVIALCAISLTSAGQGDDVMTTSNGTTVVNTKLIAKDVKGFKGTTPVMIYISKNKIVKIEALPNQDTPKFFKRAKTLLAKYEGLSVSKAAKLDVDAVSGATYSSKGLIGNVKAGLSYYKNNK